MKGRVESINVRIGFGSRGTATRAASVKKIDFRPTTMSRETSSVRSKDTLFWIYLERSEPPKVKLPKTPSNPRKQQYQI